MMQSNVRWQKVQRVSRWHKEGTVWQFMWEGITKGGPDFNFLMIRKQYFGSALNVPEEKKTNNIKGTALCFFCFVFFY